MSNRVKIPGTRLFISPNSYIGWGVLCIVIFMPMFWFKYVYPYYFSVEPIAPENEKANLIARIATFFIVNFRGLTLCIIYFCLPFAFVGNIGTILCDPGITEDPNSSGDGTANSHTAVTMDEATKCQPEAGGGGNASGDDGLLGRRTPVQPALKDRIEHARQMVAKGLPPPEEPPLSERDDTHRCPVCDVWVKSYDHHCLILGSCIGQGNYMFYWMFLFFASITCLMGSYTSFFMVVHKLSTNGLDGFTTQLTSAKDIGFILPFLMFLSNGYFGGYTFLLSLFYMNAACVGDYSLERRRQFNRVVLGQYGLRDDWTRRPKSKKCCFDIFSCGFDRRPWNSDTFIMLIGNLKKAKLARR